MAVSLKDQITRTVQALEKTQTAKAAIAKVEAAIKAANEAAKTSREIKSQKS